MGKGAPFSAARCLKSREFSGSLSVTCLRHLIKNEARFALHLTEVLYRHHCWMYAPREEFYVLICIVMLFFLFMLFTRLYKTENLNGDVD